MNTDIPRFEPATVRQEQSEHAGQCGKAFSASHLLAFA
jgi:hypothetical protein